MPEFHCNARYFLITYAQCGDLSEWTVLDLFVRLGAECIIAREDHADGGIHLHVFADFGRKYRSRRVDIFDVGGHHPNITPSTGTPAKGYDYAVKDGCILAGGLARPGGDGHSNANAKWARICSAESREEFFDLCHELEPRTLCTAFTSLSKYADWRYRARVVEYRTPNGIDFNDGRLDGRFDWVQQSGVGGGNPPLGKCWACQPVTQSRSVGGKPPTRLVPPGPFQTLLILIGRPLSLVLYGESRTGKTLWARSLGPHIYNVGLVSGEECMKTCDVDYAVFDDIRGGIKFFPAYKEWLGCQFEVSVKRLYRDPKLVRWGKPSIWVSNTDPRDEMTQADVEWLNANCIFVHVAEAIFHANT